MQKLTIKFADANAVQVGVLDCEQVLDVLEETLYIEQELTPSNRAWKRDFVNGNSTMFDYHGCEFVRVTYLGDNTFLVEDIRDV